MTIDKMSFVLDAYESFLSEMGFDAIEDDDASDSDGRLSHARWMCVRASDFVATGEIEKADRWLGFIQGILWSEGKFSIGEMRDHNREESVKIRFSNSDLARISGERKARADAVRVNQELRDAHNDAVRRIYEG